MKVDGTSNRAFVYAFDGALCKSGHLDRGVFLRGLRQPAAERRVCKLGDFRTVHHSRLWFGKLQQAAAVQKRSTGREFFDHRINLQQDFVAFCSLAKLLQVVHGRLRFLFGQQTSFPKTNVPDRGLHHLLC